jgi:hypothetical protein
MKFLAEDFNRLRHLACFKMVNYQAIFKNGINARLLGKLTQQAIIMFRRNVDQYFQGSRTINPLNSAESLKYACAGHQFLAGTKNIWWLSFCINPLPVAGQVALMLESLARLAGRFLSSYTSPMLCFSTGPAFKTTETPISRGPPHLLQSKDTILTC